MPREAQVVIWFYLLIFNLVFCSCSSSPDRTDAIENPFLGSINYPFVDGRPLGRNGPEEKFVLKSKMNGIEYTVEIPYAARDYTIEVPLSEVKSSTSPSLKEAQIGNPTVSDREVTSTFPKPSAENADQTALLDRAFGVGPKGGPSQAPSYLMGVAKVKELYKLKHYEYALIQLNNLLSDYPSSVKLLKMKGSIYLKMGRLKLAEKAWLRALQLSPADVAVKKGLEKISRIVSKTNVKSNQ